MTHATAPVSSAVEKRRQKLYDLINELEFLPTSIAVPMRVLKLKQSGTAGMAEIADALSADVALATKILSLVNSAAFSPVTRITRLSVATSMIGMKNLMPLVFGLSVGGMFNKLALRSEDRSALFQSALLKACAARAVAGLTVPEQREEAFLCGLMQDVALPVILAADRVGLQDTLDALEVRDAADRKQRELQCYGTDHCAVGCAIVTRLGLPELFTASANLHHAGIDALAKATSVGMARALDLAAALPHLLGGAAKAVQTVALKIRAIAGGADRADADALSAEILDSYLSLSKTFGESDETGTAYRLFLQQIAAEVARTTEEAVLASQSTIVGLKVEQTKLTQEVGELKQHVARSELDGLTGIFNRAAFLRRVSVLVQVAREKGIECHVGYADIDDFKRVNDTWGHALGDEAIREVAARLASIIKGRGIAARMGGDEFAFVLIRRPGENPLIEETRMLSERLSQIALTAGQSTIRIGVSTGLSSIGVPGAGQTAESILARADQLMYGVKRSGKGRCQTVSEPPSQPAPFAKAS